MTIKISFKVILILVLLMFVVSIISPALARAWSVGVYTCSNKLINLVESRISNNKEIPGEADEFKIPGVEIMFYNRNAYGKNEVMFCSKMHPPFSGIWYVITLGNKKEYIYKDSSFELLFDDFELKVVSSSDIEEVGNGK